jgi:hypothetical protein
MAPDSNTEIGSPPSPGALSMIAGMRLLGENFRNSGSNWSPALMSIGWIL